MFYNVRYLKAHRKVIIAFARERITMQQCDVALRRILAADRARRGW